MCWWWSQRRNGMFVARARLIVISRKIGATRITVPLTDMGPSCELCEKEGPIQKNKLQNWFYFYCSYLFELGPLFDCCIVSRALPPKFPHYLSALSTRKQINSNATLTKYSSWTTNFCASYQQLLTKEKQTRKKSSTALFDPHTWAWLFFLKSKNKQSLVPSPYNDGACIAAKSPVVPNHRKPLPFCCW